MKCFWRFSIAKSEKYKIVKISRFLYLILVCSQKYKMSIKDLYFIFGCNQIWRNLPMDDNHYFYIFLSMIAILAPKDNP
jgi:hypothetical protein